MPATVAIIAYTILFIVMAEISWGKFRSCGIEIMLIRLTEIVVVFAALSLHEF
jgi:hypothetical protein